MKATKIMGQLAGAAVKDTDERIHSVTIQITEAEWSETREFTQKQFGRLVKPTTVIAEIVRRAIRERRFL